MSRDLKEEAAGMSLNMGEILPGETVISAKSANALVRPDELGLSRFAFDHALGVAGLRGTEAIGGKLYLTSYRLVFRSHAVNRARGEFSVFLPTIRELRNTSSGLKRQFEVVTATQRFTFVAWGVTALIGAIEQARARFDRAHIADLAELASTNCAVLGEGLQAGARLEAVNRVLSRLNHPIAGADPVQPDATVLAGLSRAGMSSALNLAELQQKAVADD